VNRAFSAVDFWTKNTSGVAPGCYEYAPLALNMYAKNSLPVAAKRSPFPGDELSVGSFGRGNELFVSRFRRQRGDEFLEARIAAQRVPEGMQTKFAVIQITRDLQSRGHLVDGQFFFSGPRVDDAE
jgi:hypothetical protein